MSTIGIPLPATAPFDVVGVRVSAVDHRCTVAAVLECAMRGGRPGIPTVTAATDQIAG